MAIKSEHLLEIKKGREEEERLRKEKAEKEAEKMLEEMEEMSAIRVLVFDRKAKTVTHRQIKVGESIPCARLEDVRVVKSDIF